MTDKPAKENDPLAGAPVVVHREQDASERVHELPPLVMPTRPLRIATWFFRAVPLLAFVEVMHQCVVNAHVVDDATFARAAAFVATHRGADDCITAAPEWIEPRMRQALGDAATLPTSAFVDAHSCKRVWLFSLRGFELRDSQHPEFIAFRDRQTSIERFGDLSVRMYEPNEPPPAILYNFIEHYETASVTLNDTTPPTTCTLTDTPWGGGGLGQGPALVARHFVCDPTRPWLMMGPTVLNDLNLLPRHCLWQHPQGTDPVSAVFPNVPLGNHLRFFGGIHYENERDLDKGEVSLRVRIGNDAVGLLVHRDGDGWKEMVVDVPPALVGTAQSVTIETASPAPYLRTFCWAGYSYRGAS